MAQNNEQRYYDTLKRIARGYQTSDQLRKRTGQYGCSFEDELEMAYENIQAEAADAIKGKRRPAPRGLTALIGHPKPAADGEGR